MSDFQKALAKWREAGSLRYLAHELGVTPKQVSRWWDSIGIPGSFKTRKGHRRIRYDELTIGRVRKLVRLAKSTNIEIRYRMPSIHWRGKVIPTKDCRTMQDLHRRALEYGLSDSDAEYLAFRPRIPDPPKGGDDLWFDLHHTFHGTLVDNILSHPIPLTIAAWKTLRAAPNDVAYRLVAKQHWEKYLSDNSHTEDSFDAFAKSRPPEFRLREFKALMHAPTKSAFSSMLDALQEAERRVFQRPEEEGQAAEKKRRRLVNASDILRQLVEEDPKEAAIRNAALKLGLQEEPITPKKLANMLGLSRPTFYRIYGTQRIRKAVDAAINESLAVTTTPLEEGSAESNLDSDGEERCQTEYERDSQDIPETCNPAPDYAARNFIQKVNGDKEVSQWISRLSPKQKEELVQQGVLKMDKNGSLSYGG